MQCIPCGIHARLGLAHLELYKLLFTQRHAGIGRCLVAAEMNRCTNRRCGRADQNGSFTDDRGPWPYAVQGPLEARRGMAQWCDRRSQMFRNKQILDSIIGRAAAAHAVRMPSIENFCVRLWKEDAERRRLPGLRIVLWLMICHFDHWHCEPLGVLTAAAEGNLTGNPPPTHHPDRLAGGEKGTGNSWYALREKIVRALGRKPCGIRGNTLVTRFQAAAESIRAIASQT